MQILECFIHKPNMGSSDSNAGALFEYFSYFFNIIIYSFTCIHMFLAQNTLKLCCCGYFPFFLRLASHFPFLLMLPQAIY